MRTSGAPLHRRKDQLNLYVRYLRQKIGDEPKAPKVIVTKRGLGYTLIG